MVVIISQTECRSIRKPYSNFTEGTCLRIKEIERTAIGSINCRKLSQIERSGQGCRHTDLVGNNSTFGRNNVHIASDRNTLPE